MPTRSDANFSLAATGDSLITRPLSVYKEELFLALRTLLQSSDAAFTSLETIFHTFTEGYPAAESGGIHLGSDPSLADDLQWLGFDLYAAATNHSMDWAAGGLVSTVQTLDRLRVNYAGIGTNLADARAPTYLETARGRVALIAATSTFPPGANAGAQRHDVKGRPGVNPLRFKMTNIVSPDALQSLKEISAALGLETIKAKRREAGFPMPSEDGAFYFFNHRFIAGDTPGSLTEPHEGDLHSNLAQVAEARRQADWVFVSVHAHEARIDREEPAEFIKTFSRACIDEGADAVLGHGPHLLRGIELYHQKPIFYSLGNFIFQNETVARLPADTFEKFALDREASPADVINNRTIDDDGNLIGFAGDQRYWESIVAVLAFRGRNLIQITLHPLVLGFGNPRPNRGRPQLARGSQAEQIMQRLKHLSAPYDTMIEIQNGLGMINVS